MICKEYTTPENLTEKIKTWPEPQIPERGKDILNTRYLRKDDNRNVIETIKELFFRVAYVVASADSIYKDIDIEKMTERFYNLIAGGYFLPNSPTFRGAGLNINLAACFVLPIEDNRESIFNTLRDSANIHAYGGGTGFNFSELRPSGSLIRSTRGVASGPISFMEVYDKTVGEVIAQGGTRQGANMGILNYNHGDIEKFISVKKKEGKLSNFNISVGITEDFIEKVIKEEEYSLIDHRKREIKRVNAKDIFDQIVHNAWACADPGIIFLDRIDRDNPTPHIGKIVATNPCGEQPLLPYEACNLGSINLRKFVVDKKIDYEKLREVIFNSIHFLDNVIDVNNYLLEKIEESVKRNRKVGLGVMGFADMLIALEISYGSEESYKLAEEIQKFINENAKMASLKLAEERGIFPNWKGSIYDPDSEFFKGENLRLRNAARTTIAPTGTLSNIAGVEGGIEPIFSIAYTRKSIFDKEGKAKFEFHVVNSEFEKIAKEEGFYSKELIEEIINNKGSLKNVKKPIGVSEIRWEELQKIFITSHELAFEKHIKMQAVFQKHTNSAVSKTINLPNSATEDDVKKAYLLAYKTGLKGITIYRDGCKSFQVLSIKKEEKKTCKDERPRLIGTTIKQITPHGKAFITLNCKRENNNLIPYEAFLNIGKSGKDLPAISEGFGRLISCAFKYSVPFEEILEQLNGISGETQTGFGLSRISSLPDAIAKGLQEAYSQLNEDQLVKKEHPFKNLIKEKENHSGNFCPDCGSSLMHIEGCQKCICGFSKC
jgi:ribonucleoside-diphosphate reductase alpha chain